MDLEKSPACSLFKGTKWQKLDASISMQYTDSFTFDARGAIGVAERANYIARVRAMANGCAASYLESREQLGFPLLREK